MLQQIKCLCVVLFIISSCGINAQLEVGEVCTLQSTGNQGTCKLLTNCEAALKELKEKQIFPQTCGFKGTQPIVCCNEKETTTTTTTTTTTRTTTKTTTTAKTPKLPSRIAGEKSKQMCKEYGELVKVTLPNPVALIGAKPITRIDCTFRVVPLVVGGKKAEDYEFPHMVEIGFPNSKGEVSYLCGGSLISDQYVLTAAHCFSGEHGSASHARMGLNHKNRTTDYKQEFRIIELIKYPSFTIKEQYNDIGLMKLDRKVKTSPKVRPACLYVDKELQTEKAIATGWGRVGFVDDPSDQLLKVTLDFISQQKCNETYYNPNNRKLKSGIVADTQLCAGSLSEEQKDTCQGDSGGPLQIYSKDASCTYKIIGVTSFGKGCGFFPGVYTKVSSYNKWIEDVVWP